MRGLEAARRPESPDIPDKLYFRIGEVSQLSGVKPHVLRYWETEFSGISPRKSGKGHRLYRRADVERILEIKHLLYEKRYTIEGARKQLATRGRRAAPKGARPSTQAELFEATSPALEKIRQELAEILNMLR